MNDWLIGIGVVVVRFWVFDFIVNVVIYFFVVNVVRIVYFSGDNVFILGIVGIR